ncbi:MAG: hypothetical protein KC635_21310, partial [Myxococcales bacterium]|nr:hypothetical protein [Myxococcales bacterium]
DDDCDGQTDEDYASVATSCGTGACAGSGVTSCVDGDVVDSCATSGGQPQDADCDHVDDDCDGATDEDYAPVVTHCGVGACERTGMTSCTATGVADSCQAGQPATGDATCNDVDDDCDGATDEDYPETATSCGTGRCAASGTLRCVAGTPTDSCTAGTPAASDTSCNRVDDDCNGETDEDFAPQSTSCGTGACAASGQSSCVNGEVLDGCTPLAPQCDGAVCGSDGCGGSCGTCAPIAAACASPTCAAGQCDVIVTAGSCYIGGACYDNGKRNPQNPCQVCDATTAPRAWSPVAAGTSCDDDGESCTTDACNGAGACKHTANPDFSTCSDGDAETVVDMCLGGRCGGFTETREPVAGTFGDAFAKGSEGYAGYGANGLATITSAAGNLTLAVTTYTTGVNGVTTDLGPTSYATHTAVDRDLVVNANTLWELVDGVWTSAADTGSLRAAWPFPVGASAPPGFDRVVRYTPTLSLTRYVYGVGVTSGSSPYLVVRRCSFTSICAGTCAWSCGVMSANDVATDYAANITFYGGQPVIGSNYGDQGAPSQLRILRVSGQDAWYADTALSLTASGRRLLDFRSVGGGALAGSPPEWLVGAGTNKLLYVSNLSSVQPIGVPGAPSTVSYERVTTFQGYVVVLARYVVNDTNNYGIAFAKIDDQLAQSASWGFRALFPATDRRTPVSIAGDPRGLSLLGGAVVGQSSQQRAMWRFEVPRDVVFRERFSARVLPSGWTSVDQGQAQTGANWHVDSGTVVEDSNAYDVQGDASVVPKRGTFLELPSAVGFGSGTLRVQVRATDDDGYGLMWGVQNEETYVRVSLDRQRAFARVVKASSGVFTTLAENLQYTPPPMGLWHSLEVERSGPLTTIRVNGATLFQFTDSSSPSGGAALYSWGMQDVYFDDVTIAR